MKRLTEVNDMYSAIFKIINKYKDECVFDIEDLEFKARLHIFGIELSEKYGLDINLKNIRSLDYNNISEFQKIGMFGEKYQRSIGGAFNGEQPKDELLYYVTFPTGAYIFGDGTIFNKDYPLDFFKKFWEELKTFKPDYIDEMNSKLYWKIENAKDAFNSFNGVLAKYNKLNEENIIERRIQKMKDELAKLESLK